LLAVAAVGSSDNIASICHFHENYLEENLELSILYASALEALIGFQALETDPALFN
jgi:hypothetical protein